MKQLPQYTPGVHKARRGASKASKIRIAAIARRVATRS